MKQKRKENGGRERERERGRRNVCATKRGVVGRVTER